MVFTFKQDDYLPAFKGAGAPFDLKIMYFSSPRILSLIEHITCPRKFNICMSLLLTNFC